MTAEQQAIATLKIRLFDANEQLAATQNQAKEFSDTLTRIVQLLAIEPIEGEDSIALVSIVEAVEKLVAPQTEEEGE